MRLETAPTEWDPVNLVLYPITPMCNARSLGPPRNPDFIRKLQIKLIWYKLMPIVTNTLHTLCLVVTNKIAISHLICYS